MRKKTIIPNPFIVQTLKKLPIVRIIEEYQSTKISARKISNSSGTEEFDFEAQRRSTICTDGKEGENLRQILYDDDVISFRGKELLLYILFHLKLDIDYIDLATNLLIERLKWKDREKIVAARKELQSIGLIVLKAESTYWINPYYIFCGNRLKYYKQNYPDSIEVVSVQRKKLVNHIIEEQ